MISVEWKEAYLTGIEEVDLQHKFFVSLINRIADKLNDVSDPVYQYRLLSELSKYANFHFLSEENIIYEKQYDGMIEHQKKHAALMVELNEKIEEIKSGEQDAQQLLMFVMDWFVNHTVHEDIELFKK